MLTRILGISFGVLLVAGLAQATMVDLTTAGASGTINGAIFTSEDQSPTGSGVYDSFVRVSANTDIIQAYNTTVNGTFDVDSSPTFNHELLLTEVPIVDIDGTLYREFILDINQTKADPLESLDEIQVFLSGTKNQSVETFTAAGVVNLADATLVYRLDGPGATDNYLLLNYALGSGSGSGDMYAYIPNSVFTGGDPYVYLYSRFGENDNNNDGYEEWGTLNPTIVPEPASLILIGLGLAGVALRKRLFA